MDGWMDEGVQIVVARGVYTSTSIVQYNDVEISFWKHHHYPLLSHRRISNIIYLFRVRPPPLGIFPGADVGRSRHTYLQYVPVPVLSAAKPENSNTTTCTVHTRLSVCTTVSIVP